MTRYIQEGPMWRRAVISMVAMLGVSAAFLGVVMLVLGSIVDLAVAPSSADDKTQPAESAESASETDGKPKAVNAKDSDGPGEQS